MHFRLSLLIALGAVCSVSSTSIKGQSAYSIKETHSVPPQWTEVGVPHPEHIINLKIGLKNHRFHELERHLYEVSDPSHPRYGQHFSQDQVNDLVRPSAHTSSLVSRWLSEHGISQDDCEYNSAGDWISVPLTVSRIEDLLDTKYSIFEHDEGEQIARTTSWSLPQYLHKHIATIQPTTIFLRTSPRRVISIGHDTSSYLQTSLSLEKSHDVKTACNFSSVTPTCLRTLYNTIDYTPRAPTKNFIGFTNYLGQVTNRSDAEIFLSNQRPNAIASARNYKEISIKGGLLDNGTNPTGVEADLDVETILGQVYPIHVTSYSTGGKPPFKPDNHTTANTNEPYLSWINYVLNHSSIPQTISTSYGDDEQTVPKSYADAVCQGFAQLGLRGVSILFSSGDDGVGRNGTCISNDKSAREMFIPEFPTSCPFVTSVGGTKLYPEVVAYNPRNGYASGGGFSNYYPTPPYQKHVVKNYIKGLDGLYDGLYNKTGRGYPDLAAQGYQYQVVYRGRTILVDGTSASAPTMSSVIALVNDALIAAGRPPLGFLNPWLYKGAGEKAFNDITNGSVIGCGVDGFEAKKGWDAASGWGTPDFAKILEELGLEL